MTLLMGIIADDLTGGLEAAGMLVRQGVRCAYVTHPDALADCGDVQAVVVALKTRVIAADAAVVQFEAAARGLLALGARQIFFKYCATFDSTDRGNIGPCADALRTLIGADSVGFCPAFPDAGRTVYRGHLFVFDDLLSDSPKKDDPLTPMTDPRLADVLRRQSVHDVGNLMHDVISAGDAAMHDAVARLVALNRPYVIFDTLDNTQLAHLAGLTVDWPLMTGNSSIVAHYPAAWARLGWLADGCAPQRLPAVQGHAVVLAGSCSARTQAQLQHFGARHPLYAVDLAAAHDVEQTVAGIVAWAAPLLAQGPVGIATASVPQDVHRAQRMLGVEHAASRAEQILSGVALALHALGVRRFMVAGGETSGAVMARLGVDRLDVGPYVELGVGQAVSLGPDPVAVCLKSGKLGAVDMFASVLHAMTDEGRAPDRSDA